MRSVDPSRQPPEVAAFLYLVKGSVLATDDATAAMTMLDRARLLGPGTLVEEAALRRSVALAVAKGDGAHFMSAAEQYARRYLRSPYSSQFAEAFVSGIIELNGKLDLGEVERTIDWMSREQARAVYLRLARRAAIDGDATLLDFASRKASQYPPAGIEEEDPRSELYSSISSVTSETVEDVLSRLRDLDSARLSAADRALLAAAKAVAAEVVAPVEPRQAKPAPQPADIATEAPAPDAFADEAASTDDIVTSARARLEAVDKLLQETKR